MKIKLDENLPASLRPVLSALGHDVDTVHEEGLAGHKDPDVWAAAQRDGRFLITQDLDFAHLPVYAPGTHFGILLVRLGNAGRLAIAHQLEALFAAEAVEDWTGCIVVVTENKLRVRRTL